MPQDELLEFHDFVPGRTLRVIPDHRNSIAALIDESTGQIHSVARYTPEGLMRVLEPDGTVLCDERASLDTTCTLPIPFGFNGMWRSEQSGLSYMRNRWYSPQLAQFMSHDPLEYIDSYNLYAFATLDPINFWDPWGLSGKNNAKDPKPCVTRYYGSGFGIPDIYQFGQNRRPEDANQNNTTGSPRNSAVVAQLGEVGHQRLRYNIRNRQARNQAKETQRQKGSTAAAKEANLARRQNEAAARKGMPFDVLNSTAAERNRSKYRGDPLGPTYEYFKAEGRSDADIIRTSGKTNRQVNFGGALLGVGGAVGGAFEVIDLYMFWEVGSGVLYFIPLVSDPSNLPDGTRVITPSSIESRTCTVWGGKCESDGI